MPRSLSEIAAQAGTRSPEEARAEIAAKHGWMKSVINPDPRGGFHWAVWTGGHALMNSPSYIANSGREMTRELAEAKAAKVIAERTRGEEYEAQYRARLAKATGGV